MKSKIRFDSLIGKNGIIVKLQNRTYQFLRITASSHIKDMVQEIFMQATSDFYKF